MTVTHHYERPRQFGKLASRAANQHLLDLLGLGNLRHITAVDVAIRPLQPILATVTTLIPIIPQGGGAERHTAVFKLVAIEEEKPAERPAFDLDAMCQTARERVAVAIHGGLDASTLTGQAHSAARRVNECVQDWRRDTQRALRRLDAYCSPASREVVTVAIDLSKGDSMTALTLLRGGDPESYLPLHRVTHRGAK